MIFSYTVIICLQHNKKTKSNKSKHNSIQIYTATFENYKKIASGTVLENSGHLLWLWHSGGTSPPRTTATGGA